MTELSETILRDYQVRKTKKQKQRFEDLLRTHFPALQVQAGGFPKNRNLILGDPKSATILLSAHYDTCAQLPVPNFIMPKRPLLSILYSLVLIVPMVLIVMGVNFLLDFISTDSLLHYWTTLVLWFGLLALMLIGPANRHTANDNTSGVITLCEILAELPEEARDKVAFIFFDNEESGLLGSAYFRKIYKNSLKNKLLINFDCVGDGDAILISMNKAARNHWEDAIGKSLTETDGIEFLLEKAEKVYYPSDQAGFPVSVAVAALKRNKVLGYYMDKIHTARDTNLDEGNVKLLRDWIYRLLENQPAK